MTVRTILAIAATVLAVVAVACGSGAYADPTPVQTFKITPAADGQQTPPPATATATVMALTPGGAVEISIAGVDSTFDKEALEAPAGVITVKFDNRDSGIVHNIHFFKGSNARGEDAGETELEAGPLKQELTMTLGPGGYFYQCDAHPTTMSGTLRVQ